MKPFQKEIHRLQVKEHLVELERPLPGTHLVLLVLLAVLVMNPVAARPRIAPQIPVRAVILLPHVAGTK